jgi:hypothetical protein
MRLRRNQGNGRSARAGNSTITFLRHSLTVIRGFVREADVYDAVQKQAIGEEPVVTFAGQLENLSNTFVAMHNPDHERWNTYPPAARRALDVLNLFNINPLRPLLLGIAHKFDKRDATTAFAFSVSLAVRLMIASSTRTGTVEEGLADAAHEIFDGTISGTHGLKTKLRGLTPTDGQFRAAFEVATVSNRKLARYYLRSLEFTAKGQSEPWHIPNDDQSIINLEHVLPERPIGIWPQFNDDEVKIYRNRIGNLALLRASENSDLKSDDFTTKSAVYRNCPYELTSQIAQEPTWTTAAIVERQKTLSKLAVATWPI